MAWKEQLLFYKQSPYQRIAFFTESDGSLSLTLDDYWQFNSKCEHIYHECLFTMPGLFPKNLKNVLILGGGDGLGVRELLKYKTVEHIDMVDLDPEMIKFAKTNIFMKNLNKDSMNNPKLKVEVTDAKKWLAKPVTRKYDLVIVDFPDPTSDLLWTLYTKELYGQIASRLSKTGIVAIQSSTYNTKTFELIYDKLDKVFPFILGYHTGASSVFCGFFLTSFTPIKMQRPIPVSCRWLKPELINMILGLPVANSKTKKKKSRQILDPDKLVLRAKPQLKGPASLGELGQPDPNFFPDKNPINVPQEGPSLFASPVVKGGLAVAFIIPLLLKVMGK